MFIRQLMVPNYISCINGPLPEILVLVYWLTAYVELSYWARGLIFGLVLHLHPYFGVCEQ